MAEPTAKSITIPVEVADIRPRADKSWKISFETRELTGDEVGVLVDNFQGAGWLLFSPNEVKEADIPDAPAEPGTKTQSQRVRARIMILWQKNGRKGDPEAFYRTFTEKILEFIDTKIEAAENMPMKQD